MTKLEITGMNSIEQARLNPLYESMQRALKLQGKAKATQDAYSRAVRRVADSQGPRRTCGAKGRSGRSAPAGNTS